MWYSCRRTVVVLFIPLLGIIRGFIPFPRVCTIIILVIKSFHFILTICQHHQGLFFYKMIRGGDRAKRLFCMVLIPFTFLSLVSFYFSQKRQNFIYIDIFKLIFPIICDEKAFSDKSKYFTFNAKMFNSAGYLIYYTLWLLLLNV